MITVGTMITMTARHVLGRSLKLAFGSIAKAFEVAPNMLVVIMTALKTDS
jgi:hypothetical protein